MTIDADNPGPVFALCGELVDAFARRSPVQATYAGLSGPHDRWDDYAPEACSAWDTALADFERRLAATGPSTDRFERLAARVMTDYLADKRQAFAEGDHLRDLNSIESTFQHIARVFEVMPLDGPSNVEALCGRLETIDVAFEGWFQSLGEGSRQGLTVALRQVRAAIAQARASASSAGFVASLPRAVVGATPLPSALTARLAAATTGARASFEQVAVRLERDMLPHATESDAVGRERYLRAAQAFLGARLDPEATYAWGWTEVHAIEAAMTEVARSILPGTSLSDVITTLTTDPAYAARDVEDFLVRMRERQLRALAELDGRHFDIPDGARRIEVRLAPPGGPIGAYYVPPSEDLSRPGTVWYALGEATTFPLYDEVTTAYHEGFPGHHLQCTTQVLLADRLSRLHRLLAFWPGHGEGWALYAEHLMHELGYLERPEYVLGMLGAKLARACRVVVDIGAHLGFRIPNDETFHPGEPWSHALVVEFLQRRGFFPADRAASEATRYLGWPAQAISYKIGERAILDLRSELERRQGDRFSLKDFHARVIGSGSVGLDLLREIVLEDP